MNPNKVFFDSTENKMGKISCVSRIYEQVTRTFVGIFYEFSYWNIFFTNTNKPVDAAFYTV